MKKVAIRSIRNNHTNTEKYDKHSNVINTLSRSIKKHKATLVCNKTIISINIYNGDSPYVPH